MHEIRLASIADLDAIALIEQLAGFSQWSKNQLIESIENHTVWVVECKQQQIIAFAVFTHVIDESELLNIVVMPEEQGKGVAIKLMQTALQQLADQQIVKCLLEVAASNAPAIKLYEKLGFKSIAVRQNYYSRPEGKEDAMIMQLDLAVM